MASYTDKIPTFNPYVAQQPVDAMLKVGMYKQQKYEDGIQKIQSSIDNVAGLDIANPVQQKYLQSKLNALGNNLTFLAAGDFSDFSLVNSVNGMTKQITKDEDVINAVSSTAKMRAGYKKKSELEKKGLTDKNNDDYYDQYVNDYVNNEDVKASFNADYVPYTNIVKKLQEALVGIGESSTIAEQIFVTGSDGKPLITNGQFTYADSKAIDKLVTNKPAVMAAIGNVLNEGSVKQQLGIDGWATYRNTEATTLLEPLKNQYDDEKDRLEQQSVEISAMLNSTNISPEDKEMYTNAAAEIEASLLKNDNTFMSLTKEAEDNPESFKQSYYTQGFKQRLMNQFVKEETSRTYGRNDALEVQMTRDKNKFDQDMKRRELSISESKLSLDYLTFYRDSELDPVTGNWNKKPDPEKKSTTTFDANKPLFTGGISGDKVDAVYIMKEDISALSTDKNKMALSIYADFIRTNKNDPSIEIDVIKAQADKYAQKLGVTTEAFLDRWATNIKNKYDENDLTPPPNLNENLIEYNNTAFSLNNKVNSDNTARASASREAGLEELEKSVLKGKTGIKFTYKGQPVQLSAKEIIDISLAETSVKTKDNAGHDITMTLLDVGKLNDKQLKYAEGTYGKGSFGKMINGKMTSLGQKGYPTFDMGQRMAIDKIVRPHIQAAGQIREAYKKTDKIYNEKLAKIVGVSDTVTGTLPTAEASQREVSVAKVVTYVTGAVRNYASGSDKEKILKAIKNDATITWTAKKPTNSRETWTGNIIISDKDGKDYTITNVNQTDLSTFTDAKFTKYEERPIQDALNINDKTKSTNAVYMPNSPDAWRTAYFKGGQINPEVQKQGWSYRADVINTNGGYRLVHYVRKPGNKQFTTIYGEAIALDESIIDNTIRMTTPAQLNAMYLNYEHSSKSKK
jgi:hypothetical protein